MSNNLVLYEVLAKQYLRSILDISAQRANSARKTCMSVVVQFYTSLKIYSPLFYHTPEIKENKI